jgi:iron-sulfur cluster assembly protein
MSNITSLKKAPFNITPKALEEVNFILKEKNIPEDYHLRVGVKGGGGCGGASFILGFDQQSEGDDIYLIEGIKVLMEKKHAMFLAGKEIDFEDGAVARGFIFK